MCAVQVERLRLEGCSFWAVACVKGKMAHALPVLRKIGMEFRMRLGNEILKKARLRGGVLGREQGAAKRPKLKHVAAEAGPKAPALDEAQEHGPRMLRLLSDTAGGGALGFEGDGGGGGVGPWAFANDSLPLGLASSSLTSLAVHLLW